MTDTIKDPTLGDQQSYTQALFGAAQLAVQARNDGLAANEQRTEDMVSIGNHVRNSWTFYISKTSLQFSVAATVSNLTPSQLKGDVTKELNAYLTDYVTMVSPKTTGGRGGWNNDANLMSFHKRVAIAGIIGGWGLGTGNLRFTPSTPKNAFTPTVYSKDGSQSWCSGYHFTGHLTSSCAKEVFTELDQAGCNSQFGATVKLSHVTLLQLTDHVASLAKHGASATAMQGAQALLRQAQTSQTGATNDADSGLSTEQNQVEQDSNMAQQDAMLLNSILSAMQQTATGTIQ